MKLNKPYTNKEYANLAVYCNKNGLIIEDKGDYLEAVNPPEPSIEQKKAQIRHVRNQYLEQTDKFMIADYPITDEERELYKQYRTYLRTYPECRDWYKANPKTYDEWYALYLEADKLQSELTVAHQPTEVQDEQG